MSDSKIDYLPIKNGGETAFAVPHRHLLTMIRLGPWFLVEVPDVRGAVVATITSRNGGEATLLTAHEAIEYLDGRGTAPEMRTEPIPAALAATGFFH